jgi:catechol 2,3-dioxygenase-like lactoylglutathione lyase family enzyme
LEPQNIALHHVNLIVTDLPRSLAFYQNLFGLTIIERPPFKVVGGLTRLRRPAVSFDSLFARHSHTSPEKEREGTPARFSPEKFSALSSR